VTQKKILITGSNGLLGQKLVKLLVKQPAVAVIATAIGKNRLSFSEGYQYLEMDITKPNNIAEVVEAVMPDVIIHTAAMTNVDQCEDEKAGCWTLNVEAVATLIDVCERHQIFLCHLSTDFIFDGEHGPYQETDLPNPISYYGQSKWKAEQLVQQAQTPWAIVRTVLVYGIADDMSRSNIILWVKNSLEANKAIKVVTDQLRTPTLAEDLAIGCWLVVEKEATGIFHISGKDFLSPYEMAIKTADYFKLDKTLISEANASNFTQAAKRPPRTGFILAKARTILNYNPVSFEEGIAFLAKQLS
jgi:dTDP-4-dehydrorhamnose reductase